MLTVIHHVGIFVRTQPLPAVLVVLFLLALAATWAPRPPADHRRLGTLWLAVTLLVFSLVVNRLTPTSSAGLIPALVVATIGAANSYARAVWAVVDRKRRNAQ